MKNRGKIVVDGKAWVFGHNINTDVIHPPDYFSLDPDKVKRGLFARFDPTLQPRIQPGDMIIAGKNFGCGSSRETSMRSLKLNQIGAIVAIDFARIFFRNATNLGLPCLQFSDPSDLDKIEPGEVLSLDCDAYTLQSSSCIIALLPIGDFVREIWSAGGLLELLDRELAR